MQKHDWNVHLTIIVISAATLGLFWLTRKSNKLNPFTKWKAVGKVKNLCIYPLKGAHRMELQTATCTKYGLRAISEEVYQFYDRNLIVYKEINNEYITSAVYPKLLLVKTESCGKDIFLLRAPNVPDAVISFPHNNIKPKEVLVWQGARIFMLDCGNEAAQWISRYIYETDSGLRIGFHDGRHRRNIYENSYFKQYCDIYPVLTNDATGMYSYLCSYSLINHSSVNELKTKIITDDEENISVHNFRANIIIEDFGGHPYVEDNWTWIKIGDVIFYIVKPNTRCSITNLNPNTSDRSKKFEPMATLKQYRQLKTLKDIDLEGTDPVMGCYMGLYKGGIISIDDIVYVGDS